jgi:hypothetical protein
VNLAGGNYRLSGSSPYRGSATDGTDVGCNIDALAPAASAASSAVSGAASLPAGGRR